MGGASWSPDGMRIAFYEASAADWRVMGRTFQDLEVKIHLTAFTRHFGKVVKSSIALQQAMVRQLLPLGLELHLDPDHASKFAHNALLFREFSALR